MERIGIEKAGEEDLEENGGPVSQHQGLDRSCLYIALGDFQS